MLGLTAGKGFLWQVNQGQAQAWVPCTMVHRANGSGGFWPCQGFSTIGVRAECGGRRGQEVTGSWVKEPSLSAKVFGLTLFKGFFIGRSKTSRFIHWTNLSGNGEEDKVETRETGSWEVVRSPSQ